MGFDGKTLIHPGQIEPVNGIFGVDVARRAEAKAIIDAYAEAGNRDRGVISLDGRMIERLHLEMAERLIEKAARIAARHDGDHTT